MESIYLRIRSIPVSWIVLSALAWMVGWPLGWGILSLVPSSNLMRLIFWLIPALVVGLAVGLAQSIFVFGVRLKVLWWLPYVVISSVGVIASTLVLVIVVDNAFAGDLALALQRLEPWQVAYAIILLLGLPIVAFIHYLASNPDHRSGKIYALELFAWITVGVSSWAGLFLIASVKPGVESLLHPVPLLTMGFLDLIAGIALAIATSALANPQELSRLS